MHTIIGVKTCSFAPSVSRWPTSGSGRPTGRNEAPCYPGACPGTPPAGQLFARGLIGHKRFRPLAVCVKCIVEPVSGPDIRTTVEHLPGSVYGHLSASDAR